MGSDFELKIANTSTHQPPFWVTWSSILLSISKKKWAPELTSITDAHHGYTFSTSYIQTILTSQTQRLFFMLLTVSYLFREWKLQIFFDSKPLVIWIQIIMNLQMNRIVFKIVSYEDLICLRVWVCVIKLIDFMKIELSFFHIADLLTSLWAAQYFISHGIQYTLAVLCGFPFLAQVSQKVGFSRAEGKSSTDKSVCALKHITTRHGHECFKDMSCLLLIHE